MFGRKSSCIYSGIFILIPVICRVTSHAPAKYFLPKAFVKILSLFEKMLMLSLSDVSICVLGILIVSLGLLSSTCDFILFDGWI